MYRESIAKGEISSSVEQVDVHLCSERNSVDVGLSTSVPFLASGTCSVLGRLLDGQAFHYLYCCAEYIQKMLRLMLVYARLASVICVVRASATWLQVQIFKLFSDEIRGFLRCRLGIGSYSLL